MADNVMAEEREPPEPTVGLGRLPSREDFMAVLQAATWDCECPPLTSRLFAAAFDAYAARRCCKGCQARRALFELVRWSEAP